MNELYQNHKKKLQFLLLLIIFAILNFFIDENENNILWRLPPLFKELPFLINDSIKFLLQEWWPIEIYDAEIDDYETSALFREITRSISAAILFTITFIREILLGGAKTFAAIMGWSYVKANPWAYWPALPWTVVSGLAILLAYRLQGFATALFAFLATFYISIFGQWQPSMETLSFVLITAPVAALLGIAFGIWCYKSKTVEAILNPLLNIAQTMPHYSYLIPVIVLFGVGDHAAAVATIIFATPPMVRLTLLGLKNVPSEVLEAGLMSGCTNFQLMFKVLIPAAKRDVLLGVNQVVMQCLAMTVIASFVGAQGLGSNLMIALNSLKIGTGLEIGICIVLLAVLLDKLSIGWAQRQKNYFDNRTFIYRHINFLILAIIFLCGTILSFFGTFLFQDNFNYFYQIPHNKGLTTEWFWQGAVDWIWEQFFDSLNAFNKFLISNMLIPMRDAYLAMPAIATFVLVLGSAYIIAGIKSALIVCLYMLFIAFSEYWDRALITAYMASFSVIAAGLIGITIGTLCAQNKMSARAILYLCDFLQTFPSFIYLIPVILLFGITDTSVIIAAITYASVPAIRYTVEGLRHIPQVLQDAGAMAGVSHKQRLLNIDFPLAFPHIALGLNQTLIFALFMVIIGAFIGTTDLGQLILKAISDPQGTGIGITLGLCVAFIGLTFDQIVRVWALKKKEMLAMN